MNTQMTVTYQGQLRNQATHLKSGNMLITDAPIDNQGKGEAFSPTDLLCTSLATCMLTLMGITSQNKGIELGKVHAEIEKVMASDPRRVCEIRILFTFEPNRYTEKEKTILENAAKSCPVAQSIHPNIVQVIEFVY